MKKAGILNAQFMYELTKLRHMDKMVICDAGFPIPQCAVTVDVSLTVGIPTMPQVLKAVLNEIIVEEYVIFDMMKDVNTEYYDFVKTTFKEKQKNAEISMSDFQEKAKEAKFFVRTGDLAPCANIMLTSASGVPSMCEPLDIICQ